MSPEFTGFALGLLLGAAKVMAIAAVGFGVAWWRARGRIRALEAEQLETDRQILESDNLRQINESLSDLRLYLERLDTTQAELLRQLSGQSGDRHGALPPGPSSSGPTD